MEIKLLKVIPSVRNKNLLYCDFKITIGDFEIVIKGCHLQKSQKWGLVLSFPKMYTEGKQKEVDGKMVDSERVKYTPVIFTKPEQHEYFRKKGVELILELMPGLKPSKEESYDKSFRTDGTNPIFYKDPNGIPKKTASLPRKPGGNFKGNRPNTRTEKASPRMDISKYSDMPKPLSKPSRNFVR